MRKSRLLVLALGLSLPIFFIACSGGQNTASDEKTDSDAVRIESAATPAESGTDAVITSGDANLDEVLAQVPGGRFNALLVVNPAEALDSEVAKKLAAQVPATDKLTAPLRELEESIGFPAAEYKRYLLFLKDFDIPGRLEHHSAPINIGKFKTFLAEKLGINELERIDAQGGGYWRGSINGSGQAFSSVAGGIFVGQEETIQAITGINRTENKTLLEADDFAKARRLLEPRATATLLIWEGFDRLVSMAAHSSSRFQDSMLEGFVKPLEQAEAAALALYLGKDIELKLRVLFIDEKSAKKFKMVISGLVALVSLLTTAESPESLTEEQKRIVEAATEISNNIYVKQEGNLVEAGLKIAADSKSMQLLMEYAGPALEKLFSRMSNHEFEPPAQTAREQ